VPNGQSWAPPLARVAGYATVSACLAVAAAGIGARWHDSDGRLLVGVVALALAVLALRDAVVRPTVRADLGGLEIRDGIGRHRVPWVAVRSVRAEPARHSRRLVGVETLEVDTIDGLFVLSRRQLGAPPADVAARLEELRLTSF
jgi:Bacterial PH domain